MWLWLFSIINHNIWVSSHQVNILLDFSQGSFGNIKLITHFLCHVNLVRFFLFLSHFFPKVYDFLPLETWVFLLTGHLCRHKVSMYKFPNTNTCGNLERTTSSTILEMRAAHRFEMFLRRWPVSWPSFPLASQLVAPVRRQHVPAERHERPLQQHRHPAAGAAPPPAARPLRAALAPAQLPVRQPGLLQLLHHEKLLLRRGQGSGGSPDGPPVERRERETWLIKAFFLNPPPPHTDRKRCLECSIFIFMCSQRSKVLFIWLNMTRGVLCVVTNSTQSDFGGFIKMQGERILETCGTNHSKNRTH